MQWFRANRGWAGRLALFALVLQAALAFGHSHPGDVASRADITRVVTADNAPGGSHPDGDRDHCAICAVTHLAGSLVLPPPVAVAVPDIAAPVWQLAAAPQFISTHARHFQARAPPQA